MSLQVAAIDNFLSGVRVFRTFREIDEKAEFVNMVARPDPLEILQLRGRVFGEI